MKKNHKKMLKFSVFMFIIISIVCGIILVTSKITYPEYTYIIVPLSLGAGFIVFVYKLLNCYYYLQENEVREYLSKEIAQEIKSETNKENLNSQRDIQALMLKNYDEIREYYKISKSQSRWSFWLSTLACISGIIILGFTVYSVIILKKTDIAAIGVISGAITELIAGTIFWLHNKSALQLNHYYDALHENEKALLAINLTNTLSSEERENMCKEIIRTQIYKQKTDK